MNDNIVFRSKIFQVERLVYQTNDGQSASKDVVRHPGSVAILPVFGDGRICLIRNRRITVDEVLLEIPAGTMEPPEPEIDCAFRELAEETGYRADHMELLTSVFLAPGILDEKMHLFLATGLRAGAPAREDTEEIENVLVTLDAALEMVHNREIVDAKTMLALLLFQPVRKKYSS